MFFYLLKAIEVETARLIKEGESHHESYNKALLNLHKAVKEVMKFW